MQVAILSDMHVPGQAEQLPDEFRERVRTADHVVHAGDFGSKDALGDVRDLASGGSSPGDPSLGNSTPDDSTSGDSTPGLTAVYGNADPNDVDLPPVASAEVGGVTFVVLHGIVNPVERAVSSSEGVVFGRDDWLDAIADTARARAEEPMVGVGGHSHEVEDEVHDGVRLLNPGTATGVGADRATMMTAEVADGEISVTVHEA